MHEILKSINSPQDIKKLSITELEQLAARVVRLALDRGATDAECTVLEGDEFSVHVRMREVENLTEAGSRGAGLRVLAGKRTGSAYTSDLSADGLDRMVQGLVYKHMDGLIFHGRISRDRFERIFSLKSRRWATIPHGEYVFHFEPGSSPGPNLEGKNILFFGNIRPYKGLIYLLRAFQLVRRQIPGSRLLIVGQPLEDFRPYQKEIDLLGMAKDVEIQLRYVPNEEVREVFSRATVVALPYTDIYQSGVLLLAYGAGIPVVASNVGDLGDAVEDGNTGFLVPPKDVPALRDALLSILSNPERCSQMGRRAKELADTEYNWAHIAKRTVEFYRTLRKTPG